MDSVLALLTLFRLSLSPPTTSVTRTLSISRQAGTLTKEREAKLLDMGFIFDGKQAQAVRDEYEAARQQEQQLSSGSVSDEDEHSDEQDGKREAEAVEPTTHAEDD